MTVGEFLDTSTKILSSNSIQTARLDSLVLMEHSLGIDRAKLLAEPSLNIDTKHLNVLNKYLAKRAKHVPISYIVQSSEFYGRNFYVNNHVLEPRPETEAMIDILKQLVKTNVSLRSIEKILAADVGTGSGALGITAMMEVKNLRVDLIDIDINALKVAKKNVVLHTISTNVIKADLLPQNSVNYTILLCNLPYIPDDFHINLAAAHEPKLAIFGGKDGLDIYRKLFKVLRHRQQKPLYILTESLPTFHPVLEDIAKKSSYSLIKSLDFIQAFERKD